MPRYATESYQWVGAEFVDQHKRHLDEDFASYGLFCVRNEYRLDDLDKAFETWWLFKGRTGFLTNEDASRYKRELKGHIRTRMEMVYESNTAA